MALTLGVHRGLVRDSLSISRQVAMSVRKLGIIQVEEETSKDVSWKVWTKAKERRCMLLVAYFLFNLQSIAFNVSPLLPN